MKIITPKNESDYKEILKYNNCIIDFRELNRFTLGKLLSNLKFGFVILTNIRSPTTMIYFNDKDYVLESKMINYTILTICLDLENVIEFYSKPEFSDMKIIIIDASKSIQEIHEKILSIIKDLPILKV
jgi:hypothetical protein